PQRFSRRASMTEEERRGWDKEHKEVENKFNKQIADQFRSFGTELAGVLDKKEIKHLGLDRDDKALADQAGSFKIADLDVRTPEKVKEVQKVFGRYSERLHFLVDDKERKLNSLKRGDELPSGVQQMVKVYVATKR